MTSDPSKPTTTIADGSVEPLMSLNQTRALLGSLKGVGRVSYPAIVKLVIKEGLPTVPNPFKPGSWAFTRSATLAWFEAYTHPENTTTPKRLRGPGRPPRKVA